MRTLPQPLAERLSQEALCLVHVLRLTRRDGAAFAFTDHDQPIDVGGLVAQPGQGLEFGAIETSDGLGVDTAAIAGALDAEVITAADLAAGLWDRAAVQILRLDWRDPSHSVSVFSGRLGEVRRGSTAFEAELRGLQAPLGVRVGRSFSTACDAVLGDARCGVALTAPQFGAVGVIAEIIDPYRFTATGFAAFAAGWFDHGEAIIAGAPAVRVLAHSKAADRAVCAVEAALPANLAAGVSVRLVAGCDKRAATCKTRFANLINFRGFPHMPGPDLLTAGPTADEPRDGGARTP